MNPRIPLHHCEKFTTIVQLIYEEGDALAMAVSPSGVGDVRLFPGEKYIVR